MLIKIIYYEFNIDLLLDTKHTIRDCYSAAEGLVVVVVVVVIFGSFKVEIGLEVGVIEGWFAGLVTGGGSCTAWGSLLWKLWLRLRPHPHKPSILQS